MEIFKSESTTVHQNGQQSSGRPTDVSIPSSQLMSLFKDELKDIYWAEKALMQAIPEMISHATSQDLIDVLRSHLVETENHLHRLKRASESLEKEATSEKCEAMESLIKEAREIMESSEPGVMRDAGIISAAQKVEHYEIASYGTLCAFAKTLGENDAVALLQETLDEEKEADQKLSKVAQSINIDAAHDDKPEEDDGNPVFVNK